MILLIAWTHTAAMVLDNSLYLASRVETCPLLSGAAVCWGFKRDFAD